MLRAPIGMLMKRENSLRLGFFVPLQLCARGDTKQTTPPEQGESPMKKTTTMKTAIEKILAELNQLDAFKHSESFAIKIENEGYMPLSIERHGKAITITHYFEQNGDLVPDPDLEFVDLGQEDWLPVAIQHSNGFYIRAAGQDENGNWRYKPRAMKDLQRFSRMWARNLLAQGFARGSIAYSES